VCARFSSSPPELPERKTFPPISKNGWQQEQEGLDLSLLGEEGYNLDA
jgi:hypothetical protein